MFTYCVYDVDKSNRLHEKNNCPVNVMPEIVYEIWRSVVIELRVSQANEEFGFDKKAAAVSLHGAPKGIITNSISKINFNFCVLSKVHGTYMLYRIRGGRSKTKNYLRCHQKIAFDRTPFRKHWQNNHITAQCRQI